MLAWIEASIRYSGRFSKTEKSAYGEAFGLSEATISRHQFDFQEIFEESCGEPVFERDHTGRIKGGKLILRNGASIPSGFIFEGVPRLDQWLSQALGKRYLDASSENPDQPLWILRILISSVLKRKPVFISYKSENQEIEKTVSPLSIINMNGLYSLRFNDHTENKTMEIMVPQITSIEYRDDETYRHDCEN